MNKTSSDPVFYGENQFIEKNNHGTSHISVLASNGDAVSVTSSINLYFGSGIKYVSLQKISINMYFFDKNFNITMLSIL